MSEKEKITIFNEGYEKIGVATRAEVHKKGLWHETFHCWFYRIEARELFIYFQKRASQKKDFPNKFDITAAGHLLAGEPITDGFREVKEELGVNIIVERADYLGVFPVQIKLPNFIDNEFTNVFIVKNTFEEAEFYLQEIEVSGLFSLPLTEFKKIVTDSSYVAEMVGFYQKNGTHILVTEKVQKKDFCENAATYYEKLILAFEKILENQC